MFVDKIITVLDVVPDTDLNRMLAYFYFKNYLWGSVIEDDIDKVTDLMITPDEIKVTDVYRLYCHILENHDTNLFEVLWNETEENKRYEDKEFILSVFGVNEQWFDHVMREAAVQYCEDNNLTLKEGF